MEEQKHANTNHHPIILCLHGGQLFLVGQGPEDPGAHLVETIKHQLPHHIDMLGQQSARAQQLITSITTYEKLMQNQQNEYLYFMIDREHTDQPKGFIRVCKKRLFLDEMDQLKEFDNCLCVMDFYVIDRREGTGFKLIEAASNDLKVNPRDLLVDRPSLAMCNFMKRHFDLRPVHHYNKFASFVCESSHHQ